MLNVDEHASVSVQNPPTGWRSLSEVPDNVEIIPVQLAAEDGAPSRGLLYKLKGTTPRAGVHLMHPRTDQGTNYNILPFVLQGYAVLGRAGRWPNNDVSTVHELLLLDVAAGVKLLRDNGCEKVILLGNSGGSSLAAFYQAQAHTPKGQRLTTTPAGDPCDLNVFDLPPADGVILIGPHAGQGIVLGRMIDGAVVDEGSPSLSDPDLDIYNPANGFNTPPTSSKFDPAFLKRYHAAQLARVRRLDLIAHDHIARQREAALEVKALGDKASLATVRASRFEPHMVIYRTAADPAFIDLSIDPDDRTITSYFSKRPDLENYGTDGFARYITPRAWLSTWSMLSSRARTIENVARATSPLLVAHYAGDCGARMADAQAMYDQSASPDRTLKIVHGADHFGFKIEWDGSKGERIIEGTDAAIQWSLERFSPHQRQI